MLTLHHLRIGRSIFTVWLLEELGAEYDLKVYHRHPETMRAGDELKKIHPLGKSPVIEDNELILSESGAITTYLIEKYGQHLSLVPPKEDVIASAIYNQWLHYPEGSVFSPLLIKMLLMREQPPSPLFTAFCEKEIKLHLDHIANQLDDNTFILGDKITGADFGITYMLSMAQNLGVLKEHPTLISYVARNKARPAYQAAIEKAVE